jgi:uncharacterized protein (TIGR03437 family)
MYVSPAKVDPSNPNQLIPSQVNLQIPYELQSSFSASTTTAPVILNWNESGVVSSFSFILGPVSPGIFASYGVVNLDSDTQESTGLNGSGGPANPPNSPAPPGGMVAVYYTGAGALSGTLTDGVAATPSSPVPVSKVVLTLTGNGINPLTFSNAAPANSASVSLVPGTVGVAQAAFRLPSNLRPGQYQISIGLQGQVGSGSSATLLPAIVRGNSVSVWVGP